MKRGVTTVDPVVRHIAIGNSAPGSNWVRGRCRYCSCVWERACDTGCSWYDTDETICTSCSVLRELSRKEAVALLYAAGFLKSADVRQTARYMEHAIAGFTDIVESIALGTTWPRYTDCAYRSAEDAMTSLAALGFRVDRS